MHLEKHIYILSLILLLSVYIPGLGTSFYGSRSWMDIGVTTLQPSEIVKITFIMVMASYLSRHSSSLSGIKGVLSAALYASAIHTYSSQGGLWKRMCILRHMDIHGVLFGSRSQDKGRAALSLLALLPMFYFFMADYQKERIDAF